MCLLKSNYWSSCKPKYFWNTLYSTETSLRKTWDERLNCFPKKNNFLSLFGNIEVEHYFPLIYPFWNSLQVIIDLLGGNFKVIYNWKNRCIIDVSSAPTVFSSQWEFWKLRKIFWYLLSRKLWKSVSKLIRNTCCLQFTYRNLMPNSIKSFWHI